MRWYDILLLVILGALIGGALFFWSFTSSDTASPVADTDWVGFVLVSQLTLTFGCVVLLFFTVIRPVGGRFHPLGAAVAFAIYLTLLLASSPNILILWQRGLPANFHSDPLPYLPFFRVTFAASYVAALLLIAFGVLCLVAIAIRIRRRAVD